MFKVLDEVCQPTRATKYSAMVDLYANDDVVIGAGETKIVPLGVKIDINELYVDVSGDYKFARRNNASYETLIRIKEQQKDNFMKSHFLELHPRSSLRAKGLIIGVGVIDLDYPDEIGLIVHNPIKTVKISSLYENDDYKDMVTDVCSFPFIGSSFNIKKGDKVAQCTIVEHKGYLMGIESDTDRTGGFGSTGK